MRRVCNAHHLHTQRVQSHQGTSRQVVVQEELAVQAVIVLELLQPTEHLGIAPVVDRLLGPSAWLARLLLKRNKTTTNLGGTETKKAHRARLISMRSFFSQWRWTL